jgi:subtilase family serine protease
MKLKKVLALFLTLAIVASTLAVFPAAGHVAAAPMVKRGQEAVLANLSSSTGLSYGLFTCQLAGVADPCYDLYQIRHAYGIDNLIKAGFDGKGKTIVIVDSFQSPNIVSELNTFDAFYGLPDLNGLGGKKNSKLGTFTQVAPDGLTAFDQTDANMIGWAEEITLDVLDAHAMAPGANVTLVLAKSDADADILSATQYAVDHNLGDVISQSFGENESCVDTNLLKTEHLLFAKATLKGMTLVAASGDQGAAQPTCDGSAFVLAASSPASDPLVIGVGGTDLSAAGYCLVSQGCDPKKNPAPGTYQGEVVWSELDGSNNSWTSGGGFSVLYKQPFYQLLAFHSSKQRGVPDVSFNASITHGILTWLDVPGDYTGWVTFGGTSVGTPGWASIVAIADQKAGHALGFINMALYLTSINKKAYAANFHDVTVGNNSVVENGVSVTGFNAGKGWDAATGLGSPVADQLVNALMNAVSAGDGRTASQTAGPSGDHSGHGHVFTH